MKITEYSTRSLSYVPSFDDANGWIPVSMDKPISCDIGPVTMDYEKCRAEDFRPQQIQRLKEAIVAAVTKERSIVKRRNKRKS